MKKSVVLLAVCVMGMVTAHAQKKEMLTGSEYQSAIGLRLGTPVSASFKYFITKPGALEAYAGFAHPGFGFNYFRLGVMYQHHFPIKPVPGLKWYVGGGAFVDVYSYNSSFNNRDYASTSFGLNAVGGVDYKFNAIPLNLSVDWMPSYLFADNLNYNNSFRPGYGAISVRYTIK